MGEIAVSGATNADAALDELTQGMRVTGLTASGTAEVVATEWHGGHAVTVVFRAEDGGVHQQVLLRGHTGRLRIVPAGEAAQFSEDAADFKLGMEALRIQMAGQFDPMLAVARQRPGPPAAPDPALSTATCSPDSRCGSCSRMILALARRSWPACTSRS